MSARLPSPAELLRAPGLARVDTEANGVVHKLQDLADRGDYLDAAERAADLLRGPASDVRLVAIYLAGVFVERGAPALPEILECVEKLLATPGKGTARTLDSALEWLFRAVGDRVAFHTARRDEVWQAWLRELSPDRAAEIATRSEAVLAKSPAGAAALQKLARWARSKLAPAAACARKEPAPEPAPAAAQPISNPKSIAPSEQDLDCRPDHHDLPGAGEDDDDVEPYEYDPGEFDDDPKTFPSFGGHGPVLPGRGATGLDSSRHSDTTVLIDSPALAALRDKLHAFEILLAREEFDKAAVIAHDVQATLEDFDPLVFLSSMFAHYSQLVHGAFAEIEVQWKNADTPRWRLLVQYYRTNLSRFVDEY